MPIELLSLLGGGFSGFLFKYLANRAKEKDDVVKRALSIQKGNDDSADKASKRDVTKWGAVNRRIIVFSVLSSIVLFPFIAALVNVPMAVETVTPAKSYLFGLIEIAEKSEYTAITGYPIFQAILNSLLAIVGFYFGNSAND